MPIVASQVQVLHARYKCYPPKSGTKRTLAEGRASAATAHDNALSSSALYARRNAALPRPSEGGKESVPV